MKNRLDSLKIEPVGKLRFLTFNFLEFRFFWNSENGKAMVFGTPRLLEPLVVVPYMLASEVGNFRGKKYFVKLKSQIAAVFILTIRHDSLIVSGLAVSPGYRRLGLGFFILNWTENLCKRTKVEWLQLVVLKGNTPAQHLYQKFGFKITIERKMSLTLRKRIQT